MSSTIPLNWESFLYLASEAGLDVQSSHMEELFPYVENALRGMAALREIDTSQAEPPMAFVPHRENE